MQTLSRELLNITKLNRLLPVLPLQDYFNYNPGGQDYFNSTDLHLKFIKKKKKKEEEEEEEAAAEVGGRNKEEGRRKRRRRRKTKKEEEER